MKEDALVLRSSSYSFIPQGQTEKVEGCKLVYASLDGLTRNDDRSHGLQIVEANLPYELRDLFTGHKLPAIFELSLTSVPGPYNDRNGRIRHRS